MSSNEPSIPDSSHPTVTSDTKDVSTALPVATTNADNIARKDLVRIWKVLH
jgi:hypothetical protein